MAEATERPGDTATEPTPAAAPPPPKPRPAARPNPKRQPPHAVVLHNDPVNGFDFVVGVLRKVFRYGRARAFWLTLRAQVSGRSIVWTGTLELAELKAEQVRDCGPDPRTALAGGKPLRVTIEPMPEG
jgi:ATP-dependent Clp protease adaptor protein ClpS